MTPPASVRNPLALWLGSWLFKLNPTCTTPNPSKIRPMARIREKIKVDRLLMTARGSPAASTGYHLPSWTVPTRHIKQKILWSSAYRRRYNSMICCLVSLAFHFVSSMAFLQSKKTAPSEDLLRRKQFIIIQSLRINGCRSSWASGALHNHKEAHRHPPYISHSHVYADHISHPEWGVLHAPEALPSGYPQRRTSSGVKSSLPQCQVMNSNYFENLALTHKAARDNVMCLDYNDR